MAIVNKGAFAKALWPGVSTWWGEGYNLYPTQYSDIYQTAYADRAYLEDMQFVGTGLASVKPEGSSVSFDTMRQGFLTRYTMLTYGIGFIITDEMVEDDQYNIVAEKRSKSLGKSMHITKETVGANVVNRGFNSSYKGGDGVELYSTAHLNTSGGTWQNALTTAADLSEATLEQAYIDISKWNDDRGLRIVVNTRCLLVPTDLQFEAERILYSPLRVGTSDNDLNAIKSTGKFPEGIKVNNYLTDVDAWFIITDAEDGLKYVERRADTFTDDNDFDTDNLKYKSTGRYAFGWSDPRGTYGSPGA